MLLFLKLKEMLILVTCTSAYINFHFKFENFFKLITVLWGKIKITFCGFTSETLLKIHKAKEREYQVENIFRAL